MSASTDNPKMASTTAKNALKAIADREYQILSDAMHQDGFTMSKMEVLTGTDEEMHVTFSLLAQGKPMVFTYSLGLDPDEERYRPYVEIDVGDARNIDSFTVRRVTGNNHIESGPALVDSLEKLANICADARVEAFRRLSEISRPAQRMR